MYHNHLSESVVIMSGNIKEVLTNFEAMRMSKEDWKAHTKATTCHVCGEGLGRDSVRDHCHITEKYRDAAHKASNLKLRLNIKTATISVAFDNMRGYDSHLIMQAISNNTEKFSGFSQASFDSLTAGAQFVQASLDKLVAANKPEVV